MAGLVTGIVRMGVEFAYSAPTCGSGDEDKRPDIITKVHYLIFAIILCSVSFIVMVAVSLMTPPRSKKQVRCLIATVLVVHAVAASLPQKNIHPTALLHSVGGSRRFFS